MNFRLTLIHFFVFFLAISLPVPGEQMTLEDVLPQCRGIPCLGDNAYLALWGDYRIGPQALPLQVWATTEPLALGQAPWQRKGTGPERYQTGADGSLIAALPVGYSRGEGSSSYRCLIFHFPSQTLQALGEQRVQDLIKSYRGRFMYFFTLSDQESNLSLPAIIEF